MKDEQVMLCQMVTLPMNLSDPNHPISAFCVLFHVFGMTEARVVKFRTQVGCIKCSPWGDKLPHNGRGQVT